MPRRFVAKTTCLYYHRLNGRRGLEGGMNAKEEEGEKKESIYAVLKIL